MKPGALNGLENASFGLSSPPIVYKNVVITGAHVQEGPSMGAAGDTRAWDARTGKLIWQFHSVPRPGEIGARHLGERRLEEPFRHQRLGIVHHRRRTRHPLQPFGEPTTDYWGGDRPGANLFGTSLVAVDALTGKLKWHFQIVHHDTWDYDLCRAADSLRRHPEREEDSRRRRVDQDRGRLHPQPRDRRTDLRRGRTQGPGGRRPARRPARGPLSPSR